MKKYDYIIIAVSFAILCLQILYINRSYHNYSDKKRTEVNNAMQSAVEQELNLRVLHTLNKERDLFYKQVSGITPEEIDSLKQLNSDNGAFVNLKNANDKGFDNNINYILLQLKQDKALQNDRALNLSILDSIYMAHSGNDYRHTFFLMTKINYLWIPLVY